VTPPNGREEAISIEGPDVASARLFHMKATRSIWVALSDVERRGGDDKERRSEIEKIDIKVDRHVAKLETALQNRLLRAWVAFLRMTQYGPFAFPGDDTVGYHFAAMVPKCCFLAGATGSPPKDSLSGRFTQIGSLLGRYADSSTAESAAVRVQLDKALRDVEWRLGIR
jgi:hypothetical protein